MANPPQKVEAVVFDLDGTLVDSAVGIATALNRTGLSREVITPEKVRSLVSRGARSLIMGTLDVQEADVDVALLAFRKIYAEAPCNSGDCFPGVEGVLAQLRDSGVPLGVCTNKPQGLAEIVLKRTGLFHYFGAVVGSGPGRAEKPDPAAFVETLALLRCDTGVLVGDSLIDAGTARAASAPFVYAAFGYEGIGEGNYVAVAHRAEDLGPILERLVLGRTDEVQQRRA